MTLREVSKRLREAALTYALAPKFDKENFSYEMFGRSYRIQCLELSGVKVEEDWSQFRIFNSRIDLTKPIDWFMGEDGKRWPDIFYSKINYRPGNPYGDIRWNWELNRLQFLPILSLSHPELAQNHIHDWLEKNRYSHGPSYLSAMEVALRWISLYRTACLMRSQMNEDLDVKLSGLALASGQYIENRFSTHSSAGNHLLVEAVGLFWIGKSLFGSKQGQKWMSVSRRIIWREILRQLEPDGTNKEQAFWYLGFILDAVLHYLLIEDSRLIPKDVLARIEKCFEYLNSMVLPNGAFPDYGDRDDGFILRTSADYREPFFLGLLDTAGLMLNRPHWHKDRGCLSRRATFFRRTCDNHRKDAGTNCIGEKEGSRNGSYLKTYPHGGITLMINGRGRAVFRHGPLGLAPLFGHGHADALSILLFWNDAPVLIDPGTGQYNGDGMIREYFRSTLAHNTVRIGGSNQAEDLGPFLWKETYSTEFRECQQDPHPACEASHTGYQKRYRVIHTRRIEWPEESSLYIIDSFSRFPGLKTEGALHIPCADLQRTDGGFEARFEGFRLEASFEPEVSLKVYHGSMDPFLGWVSRIYGIWQPIYSILYSSDIPALTRQKVHLTIQPF